MSAILGILGGELLDDAGVHRMLDRMASLGGEHRAFWRGAGAVLAVSRPTWQMGEGFSDGELVVEDGELAVAADASVYYRDDLRRALEAAGVRPTGGGPGHLVLAAYRAWGEACVDRLEGDWAFVVWDARTREAFCARDYGGRRTLHFAEPDGGLVLASTLGGVLAHPRCSRELNPVSIAATSAGLLAASHETAYRDVSRLLAGHALRWRKGEGARVWRFWDPAPRERADGLPFAEAAAHLRGLLTRAVAERLSRTSSTSIQLSGGWDSSAIFAVGSELLRRSGSGERLLPVSISYPPGDPGREDELIEMILEHWDASTRWIDIADIPLVDRLAEEAAAREDPFAHLYEHWNRSLVRAGAELGTRVMFDGFGGDSLFQCSPVYFAELLRRGRLRLLRRDWRARRMKGLRTFLNLAVLPITPEPLMRLAEIARGGQRIPRHLERPVAPWFETEFVRRNGIVARERELTPRHASPGSWADRELYWHLTNPWIYRMLQENYHFGVEAGVEVRSPLWDRRVIEFSATRPRAERASAHETKRLLRRSVEGLLPERILLPRHFRTGMTSGYLARSLGAALPELRRVLGGETVLGQMGIVDPARLREAVERFDGAGGADGVLLFFTLQTEVWLRAHTRPEGTPPGSKSGSR